MPWCHPWAEPAGDSEEKEEEEEVESKDPPKKLKKKLPKEPSSGESREKKLKPKGKYPGDRDGLSSALLPLESVLSGMRGPWHSIAMAQVAVGQLPPPQIPPELNPSCHIPVPIAACTCPPPCLVTHQLLRATRRQG